MGNNASINTAKNAANLIPGIGNTISSIIGFASNLGLKSKTSHLGWNEADTLAEPFSEQMVSSLESTCISTDDDRIKLWTAYQKNMLKFISSDEQGSNWWDDNTRNLYYKFFAYDLEQSTPRETLRHCFWLQAHWIFENIDGTKLDSEGSDKMQYVGNKVLIPSLLETGLISQSNDVILNKGSVSVDNTKISNAGLKLNVASLTSNNGVMIIGAIILFLLVLYVSQGRG